MQSTNLKTFTCILMIVLLATCLVACGGSKVIKDPVPLSVVEPLTTASDQTLEANLEWVIVRDGPGTWAKNADWDEYILKVRNTNGDLIQITAIAIYDSLGTGLYSMADRKSLVKESRQTARRYRNEGVEVKAGLGGTTMLAAGGTALFAGQAVGYAVLSGSAGTGAAGAAIGALAIAPILTVSGVVRSVNNNRVSREIGKRHTVLPARIWPDEQKDLHVFFPLAPSPTHIELTYVQDYKQYKLIIDTRETLQGLHIGDFSDHKKRS